MIVLFVRHSTHCFGTVTFQTVILDAIDNRKNQARMLIPTVKLSYTPLATVLLQKRIRVRKDDGYRVTQKRH